jgi:hypothetical protein
MRRQSMAEIPAEVEAVRRDFAAIRDLVVVNKEIFTELVDVRTRIAVTFQELRGALSRLTVALPTQRPNAKKGGPRTEVPRVEVRFTRCGIRCLRDIRRRFDR